MYSPRESSRFLSVVPSPVSPSSLAIVSLGERPSRFLSREVSRLDPSLSPRLSANDAITLQENAVRLRSRYEIIPGGLASRKFITITAHGPMNTWHHSRPPVYCVHEILHYAFSKVAVSFAARSPGQSVRNADEKDDGIIASPARWKKICLSRDDDIFAPRQRFISLESYATRITLSKLIQITKNNELCLYRRDC